MKFEIRPSGSQFYFLIVASNGRVLASSERYHNKADCRNAIDLIKIGAGSANVDDVT